MTGPEFLAYVKKKFIRSDKDTEIYEAITDIVADIKYDTQLEAVKEEAYVVGLSTLGDYQIALPSDFGNLIGNVILIDPDTNDRRILNKISKQTFDERYSDRLFDSYSDTYSGTPQDFCVYANQLYVAPVADKVTYKYQINYTTTDTTAVTASTTSVPFTTDYKERNVVRDGVLAEMHGLMENFEESNYWRALYTVGKQNMVVKDDRNIDDNELVQYRGI
jgi:hypothetical protein